MERELFSCLGLVGVGRGSNSKLKEPVGEVGRNESHWWREELWLDLPGGREGEGEWGEWTPGGAAA